MGEWGRWDKAEWSGRNEGRGWVGSCMVIRGWKSGRNELAEMWKEWMDGGCGVGLYGWRRCWRRRKGGEFCYKCLKAPGFWCRREGGSYWKGVGCCCCCGMLDCDWELMGLLWWRVVMGWYNESFVASKAPLVNVVSDLSRVTATIIIFVFVLYCVVFTFENSLWKLPEIKPI